MIPEAELVGQPGPAREQMEEWVLFGINGRDEIHVLSVVERPVTTPTVARQSISWPALDFTIPADKPGYIWHHLSRDGVVMYEWDQNASVVLPAGGSVHLPLTWNIFPA